ncbi:Mitochondrial import receptor subunit TOM70 [Sesamum angolense]|uniref:Mitochondrial import receptor subunit TOM70 n=1 Tax=Sesamum angolense TaxID=2727404 RepID=A0AAE2BY82_9LAMI|nr:Mitochondrial import receptor subunit TOM70 [Sesamum angolense]
MARVPSKHSRDQAQDFEGLLNNLQDWELSFKDKDKKLRSDGVSKGKLDLLGQSSGSTASARVNGKQTREKTPSSDKTSAVRQYDNLREYEALSRLSGGIQSQENFVDANSEKELGNEFFKQKKFADAIDCYSRSIALSPTAVAYANRAMAYIKLKRFQEAENDCTEALNLDDRYIKAYSRRSTARKELGKLKESIDDAEFALRLEPQNQEIKKQYAELKSLLEKEILKKASEGLAGSVRGAQPGKSKVDRNKNVQKLQSVSTSSPAGRVAEILEDHAEGNDIRDIAAEASMEVETNSIRSTGAASDTGSGTAKVTSPTALPGIFKNALSASILVDIIRCIATFFTEDMALGVEYLQNLAKIPRFDMIIMCLSPTDKADLSKIWNEVFSKGTTDYADILGICLEEKAAYLVDQQDFIPERNVNVPCSLGRLEGLPEFEIHR